MATQIRVSVLVEVTENYTGDLGNPGKVHRWAKDVTYLNGNGSSQYNKAYSDIASATTSYDVAAGVTDAQGAAITMSKLGLVLAENRGTTSGDVMRVGGNANAVPLFNLAASYFTLGPQGFALLVNPVDGWTVTAATGDQLDLTHTTGTYDHALIVAGRN
jgi:hypothetical protein